MSAFEFCDRCENVRGVLLTSDQPSFSAGMDLKSLESLQKDEAGSERIQLIGEALTSPLRCSKPVACVIEGHAIAGGLVLAAACDFIALTRLKDYLLGLTELSVGVPFPNEALECVRHAIKSNRGFRKFVFESKNLTPASAFALGFGDVLVIDAKLTAEEWLRRVASFPKGIFETTKRQVHGPFFQRINHPDQTLCDRLPVGRNREIKRNLTVDALSHMGGSRLTAIKRKNAVPLSKL